MEDEILNIASRLSIFCVLTLLVGGGLAYILYRGGGPEALGAILPLTFIGAIHLFIGPIAVYHAYTRPHNRSSYIYAYFIAFFFLAFWVMRFEGVVYYFLYAVFMVVPILLATIITIYKRR